MFLLSGNPIKILNNVYERHIEKMLMPFKAMHNSVEDLEHIKNHSYRFHYLLPLIVTIIPMCDTINQWYIMGYDLDNPIFFHHLILSFLPKFYRQQGDITFGVVCFLSLMSYTYLLNSTFPHVDFIMMYQKDSSGVKVTMPFREDASNTIHESLGRKLVSKHERIWKNFSVFVRITIFEAHMAYTVPFCCFEAYKAVSSNGHYLPSTRAILLMMFLPYFLRILISIQFISIQFILQNIIINVKQKHYLDCVMRRIVRGRRKFWKEFQIMTKMLNLSKETDAFNDFYGYLMTVSILSFFGIGCALLHGSLKKADEVPFIVVFPWTIYSCVYILLGISFNVAGSRTIALNSRLFIRLRQLQAQTLSRPQNLSRSMIIKLDLVNEYKMLMKKCAFRLLNSATINNRLFVFQIFGPVSVFYMRLHFRNFSADKLIGL